MRIPFHLLRLPVFVLLFLILPRFVFAQSYTATPSEDFSKNQFYDLDINTIHAYVTDQSASFPLSISFSGGIAWDMELEAYDVRANNYQLHTSSGRTLNTNASPIVTYKGALTNKPGSEVRLTLSEGYFRAYVRESEDVSYYMDMPEGALSKVTLMQEDPDDEHKYCASGDEHLIGHGHKPDGSATVIHNSLAPYEAEIAFVIDRLGFEQYASLNDLELELLTILNYTDAYYTIHDLTYKLTEIYVIEDLQSQPWNESNNAGQMLENFTGWASSTNALAHHDVVTLWSGLDFGSTIGIAWVGAIGSSYKQNVVNFPIGRERRNSNVHAHELGHNWGSSHVSSGGWIMSAALSSGNSEGQWHQSTINAFPGYVQNAIQHLEDVGTGGGGDDGGDGGDGSTTILSVGYSELTITGEENGNSLLDPGETADISLVIENLDVNPISNLLVTMSNDNNRARNHVTINNNEVVVESIDSNGAATVSFNVTLSLLAPVDRTLRFLFELDDGSRTSETTRTTTTGDQFLPVDLISFTAVEGGNGVNLFWETASELNNAGFEVEVQEGGGAFRRAAFVEGAGTTLDAQRYSYRLDNLGPGNFGFRLRQIDFDGTFEYSDVVFLSVLPDAYTLKQNYPNPFNPQTRIEFHMPAAGDVTLDVFDMLGRHVATLVQGTFQAGQHEVLFNAEDLPNGTFVYRLQADGFEETKMMILMK